MHVLTFANGMLKDNRSSTKNDIFEPQLTFAKGSYENISHGISTIYIHLVKEKRRYSNWPEMFP